MHLLNAELSGKKGHGFIRLPEIVNWTRGHALKEISIELETAATVLLNGGCRPGILVAERAGEICASKAQEIGISLGGGYNTENIGVLGQHVMKIAADYKLIAILLCNSEAVVAPYGGIDPVLGTNPIAIAIPTEDKPIVFDMATSSITYGEILLGILEQRKVKSGSIINEYGQYSSDPADALKGSLTTLAGYKGFGLSLVVEILAGPLVKAKAGNTAVPGTWGFTYIVIKSDVFVPAELFTKQVSSLLSEIRSVRKRADHDNIQIPGERSDALRRTQDAKYISLPEGLVQKIQNL